MKIDLPLSKEESNKAIVKTMRAKFDKHERNCEKCKPKRGQVRFTSAMCENGRAIWQTYCRLSEEGDL